MSKKILIMAGGTGGHIFPALSIAKELSKRGAIDSEKLKEIVEWLGGRNSMESDLVPRYKIKFNGVFTSGIRGKKLITIIRALFLLSFGFIFSRSKPVSYLELCEQYEQSSGQAPVLIFNNELT
jgi:UDP-N-acetylglucosamine--N-acetylmuramyl-(pentapeptide) pyrophosphoryl-undecaprenol N-acetylglucosamine transferase